MEHYLSKIFFLALVTSQVAGLSFPLDVASDVDNSNWKVRGFYTYIDDGSTLRGFTSNFLPDSFKYPNFDLSKGIWIIVPTDIKGCPTTEMNSVESGSNFKPLCYGDSNSNATFQFTLRAQLMDSVTIRYCFGGKATIQVAASGSGGEPFEESANHNYLDNWIETKVPLSGSKMVLDALVFDKGDYILIDKITVASMEVPPPSRPTRRTTVKPSTESPEPSPASGAGSLTPYLFLIAISSFLA